MRKRLSGAEAGGAETAVPGARSAYERLEAGSFFFSLGSPNTEGRVFGGLLRFIGGGAFFGCFFNS